MMKRVLLIDVSYAFKKKFNKYLSERGKMIKFDVVLSFPRFYFFGWDLTEYFERNYDLYLVSHLATTYNKNIIEDAKEYGCNVKQLGPSALTPDEASYSSLLKIIEGDVQETFWESTNS